MLVEMKPIYLRLRDKTLFGGHGAEGNVSHVSPASQCLSNGTIQGQGKQHTYLVSKTGGNKSYTNVGSVKLREKNPNKFFEKTRPKETNAKVSLVR